MSEARQTSKRGRPRQLGKDGRGKKRGGGAARHGKSRTRSSERVDRRVFWSVLCIDRILGTYDAEPTRVEDLNMGSEWNSVLNGL